MLPEMFAAVQFARDQMVSGQRRLTFAQLTWAHTGFRQNCFLDLSLELGVLEARLHRLSLNRHRIGRPGFRQQQADRHFTDATPGQ